MVARSSLVRIFEVREEPLPISQKKEDERERRASVRKGTEAVEGEVEMDGAGEGFVNVGIVKVNPLHHLVLMWSLQNCNIFCCRIPALWVIQVA